MDDRDSQGRMIVRNKQGHQTGVRTGDLTKIEVESYSDAQKRRDLANEDPISKELRLKREAKLSAETPPPATANAEPSPSPTASPAKPKQPGLGGLAAAIAKNRAAAKKG